MTNCYTNSDNWPTGKEISARLSPSMTRLAFAFAFAASLMLAGNAGAGIDYYSDFYENLTKLRPEVAIMRLARERERLLILIHDYGDFPDGSIQARIDDLRRQELKIIKGMIKGWRKDYAFRTLHCGSSFRLMAEHGQMNTWPP